MEPFARTWGQAKTGWRRRGNQNQILCVPFSATSEEWGHSVWSAKERRYEAHGIAYGGRLAAKIVDKSKNCGKQIHMLSPVLRSTSIALVRYLYVSDDKQYHSNTEITQIINTYINLYEAWSKCCQSSQPLAIWYACSQDEYGVITESKKRRAHYHRKRCLNIRRLNDCLPIIREDIVRRTDTVDISCVASD